MRFPRSRGCCLRHGCFLRARRGLGCCVQSRRLCKEKVRVDFNFVFCDVFVGLFRAWNRQIIFPCHCSSILVSITDTDVHRTLSSKFWLTSSSTPESLHTRVSDQGTFQHSSQQRGQSCFRSVRQQLTCHTHCNGYTRVHTGEAQSKSICPVVPTNR